LIKGKNQISKGNLKSPILYGITWRLMLLKDLPKLPKPIRVYMPKLGEEKKKHKEGEIIKLRWGILKGPILS
jgi:hypothetical protein